MIGYEAGRLHTAGRGLSPVELARVSGLSNDIEYRLVQGTNRIGLSIAKDSLCMMMLAAENDFPAMKADPHIDSLFHGIYPLDFYVRGRSAELSAKGVMPIRLYPVPKSLVTPDRKRLGIVGVEFPFLCYEGGELSAYRLCPVFVATAGPDKRKSLVLYDSSE